MATGDDNVFHDWSKFLKSSCKKPLGQFNLKERLLCGLKIGKFKMATMTRQWLLWKFHVFPFTNETTVNILTVIAEILDSSLPDFCIRCRSKIQHDS